MMGLLTARQYFNNAGTGESLLRDDINTLFNNVDWTWFKKDNQNVSGTVHFPGFEDKKIKVRVADKSEKFAGKDIYRYKRKCCEVPNLYRPHYLSFIGINKTLYRKRGTCFQQLVRKNTILFNLLSQP